MNEIKGKRIICPRCGNQSTAGEYPEYYCETCRVGADRVKMILKTTVHDPVNHGLEMVNDVLRNNGYWLDGVYCCDCDICNGGKCVCDHKYFMSDVKVDKSGGA